MGIYCGPQTDIIIFLIYKIFSLICAAVLSVSITVLYIAFGALADNFREHISVQLGRLLVAKSMMFWLAERGRTKILENSHRDLGSSCNPILY